MRWITTGLLALILYGVGFGLFAMLLPTPQLLMPVLPEGLVVFTGGTGRVDAAVSVLEQGFAGPVLISGVHEDVKVHEIIPAEVLSHVQRSNLTLDYEARTTRENVLNTALWAAERKITKLAVVTNRFHSLRCRVLFVLLAPNLQPTFLVVGDDASVRTLWREYNKLLLAPLLM
ncbi:MAG: YdcF family protein [Alphaproteobacteria bacterium]